VALVLAPFGIAWLLLLWGFQLTAWTFRVLLWLAPPLLAATWLILKWSVHLSTLALLGLAITLGMLLPDTALGRWVRHDAGYLRGARQPSSHRSILHRRAVPPRASSQSLLEEPPKVSPWHETRDMGPATAKIHRYRSYRHRYGRWLS
jgi:hypothetical protein